MKSNRDKKYAIVCQHVASGDAILLAFCDEPDDSEDSGWQFFCNKAEEYWDQAQLWKLSEVSILEPSIKPFFGIKPPFKVVRETVKSPWRFELNNPE